MNKVKFKRAASDYFLPSSNAIDTTYFKKYNIAILVLTENMWKLTLDTFI